MLPFTKYHLVCDVKNRVLAIFQVLDSAIATFEKIINEDSFDETLYINTVTTNQYGRVISEMLVKSYVKVDGTVQEYNISIHEIR